MPELAKVLLDGQPVPVGGDFSPPRWVVSCGVTAPEIVWTIDPTLAAQVLAKREVSIKFDVEGKVLDVKRAVVLGERPSGTVYARSVILSDVRAYWPSVHVKYAANVRTRSGSGRLLSVDGPPQLATPVDDLIFAPFSLKDELTVQSGDDVAAAILKFLQDRTQAGFELRARPRPKLTPNDVLPDAPGHVALAQALALLGGVDVYIRPQDSAVILFDRVLGAERAIMASLAPAPLQDLGLLKFVSTKNQLPKKFNVLFTREMEVRADFREDSSTGTTSTRAQDEPTLQNVVQITDQTLTVSGKLEVQGSFAEIDPYLTAINAAGPAPATSIGPLDRSKLQKLYLGPCLELCYVMGLTGLTPSQVWAGRLASLRAHYRLTFRLDRKFSQRILPGSIRAVRAALLDGPTGTRQPSPVYFDYCSKPTLRWLSKSLDARLGWNVHALPPRAASQNVGETKAYSDPYLLADCQPGPAQLLVLDNQVGIFHLQVRKDTFDQAEQIVPSLVRDLPVTDPHQVAIGTAIATWEEAALVRNHRVSFIFSCVPAGPNSANQLGKYEVSLDAALKRLGVGTQQAEGPDMDLRVGGSLMTLRYPWSDAGRDQILGAFRPDKPFPSKLIPVNDTEAKDYAESTAAAVAAGLLDHYEGQQACPFSPGLVPVGSLHTVVHTVDPEGRAFSMANAEARVPPQRPENLLSPSSRKTLLRELGT